MLRVTLALTLLLASCIDVPELDEAVPDWVDAAPYPELVPLDGLQAGAPPQEQAEALDRTLTARQARLEREAAALSGPVLDPETRARMAAGVTR